MARSVARPGKPCPRCGDTHDRCMGHNRADRPCGNWPTPGGNVCRLHGGLSPNARVAAQRRLEEAAAARAVQAFGLPRDIDPATALLEEVGRSSGAVVWLQARVVEAGADPNDLIHGTRLVRHKSANRPADDELEATTETTSETTTEVGPGVHLWVQLYQQERRHLVDACARALAAGVDERRVRLAERMGAQLADVIRAVLDDLHLTREQRALVPEVVPRHLRALAGP